MMRTRSVAVVAVFEVVAATVLASAAFAAGRPSTDPPSPIARGPHISGVVRHQPRIATTTSTSPAASQCSTPASGNYRTDCHSSGRPVNETWVTYGNGTYYAGANDYNSYNGQGQNGFYWSTDGVTWNDAGPLDLFAHNSNNAAGDPGLAVDSKGMVYYSSLFFNFYNCSIGGVELSRRDPVTGSWSYYQIAADSSRQFQDKPAIAVDSSNAYLSWTQFGSCSGTNVPSPIKVAVLPLGASSVAATAVLSVPGSTYSQGSSIGADGTGGFWVAWEEYPSATASTGSIRLAHYAAGGWASLGTNQWETISPNTFTDLPSPLSGFSFRDDSFPALTVVAGNPEVAWTSSDAGVGRANLWKSGTITAVANSGGDQFFPAIVPDGSGGVDVSFSQVNSDGATYDQWLWHSATNAVTEVTTASSNPHNDAFFSGQFIGDYNGMTVVSGTPHPIWTDIRGPDPNYAGWEMDSMVSSPAATAGTLSFSGLPSSLTAGASISGTALASSGSPAVTLSTTSSGGGFSTTSNGTYTSTLSSVPVGSTFYYKDTVAGSPTLTASASGYASASQVESVGAAALSTITVSPASATVPVGGSQPFTASGTDVYGNAVSVSNAAWAMTNSLGTFSPTSGASTTFTAGQTTGSGTVTATIGNVVGSASVTVTNVGSMNVTVVKGTTTLTGSTYHVPLIVTAMDVSTSAPLSGASVTLQVFSGTLCSGTAVASGTGTTNTSGQVAFTFNTKRTGNYCALATVTDTGYMTGHGSTPFSVP